MRRQREGDAYQKNDLRVLMNEEDAAVGGVEQRREIVDEQCES